MPEKIFGGVPRLIRGCATKTATGLQHLATSRTNLRQLARLASTCGKKNFCHCRPGPLTRRRSNFLTPTNGNSRLLTPINAQNSCDPHGSPDSLRVPLRPPCRALEIPTRRGSKNSSIQLLAFSLTFALRVSLRPSCSKNFSLQPLALTLANGSLRLLTSALRVPKPHFAQCSCGS